MCYQECQFCRSGEHEKCLLSLPSNPPGSCGGFKCSCPCGGNPNWDKIDKTTNLFKDIFPLYNSGEK